MIKYNKDEIVFIKKVIDSCETVYHFESCSDWLHRLFFDYGVEYIGTGIWFYLCERRKEVFSVRVVK